MNYVYFIKVPLITCPGKIDGYWLKIGCSTNPGRAAKRHYPEFEICKIPCKNKKHAKSVESIFHTYLKEDRVAPRETSEVFFYTERSERIINLIIKFQLNIKLINEDILNRAISDILYPSETRPLVFKNKEYSGYRVSKHGCIYGPSDKILDTGVRGDYQINVNDGNVKKVIISKSLKGVA